MTTLSIRPLLFAILIAVMGWLAPGCGRTALLAAGVQASPAAGAAASTVTPTGGVTSQPLTSGACTGGFTACGRGAATRCYDVTRSQEHCGQCGNACAPGIACQSSECQQYRCKGALTFKALPGILTADYGTNFLTTISTYLPVLADFDGDGTLDFVGLPGVAAPMALLLGKGDGTFQSHPIAPAFVSSWRAAAADLNGDGWPDLATIAEGQAAVSVRLGNGDPTTVFDPATSYPTPSSPDSLLLADLDDDGHVDLVATGTDWVAPGKHGLGLWRGAASGALAQFSTIPVGGSGFLAAADWNRDGVLDLLYGGSTLRMLIGHGDGTFDNEIACGLALGSDQSNSGLADFDHDQKIDMVVRQTGVLLGMDGCNFTTLVSIPNWGGDTIQSVGVADLDGDGHADIVTSAEPTVEQIAVYLGDGRGGFASPLTFPDIGRQLGGAFLMGDLNHDTKLDVIAIWSDGWQIFLNTCP